MKAFRFFLTFILLLCIIGMPVEAYIGVSGDFYAHEYVIPIGGEIRGAKVIIYNPSNETIHVRMHYYVKPETEFIVVNFSETEFMLNPSENKVIYVTLRVKQGCPPGTYEVTVGGEEIIQKGNESIAVPSGALHATVKVVGESAHVIIKTVDVAGNTVPCNLKLLALPSGYVVNQTDTGQLRMIVAPGRYRAEAYLVGTLLNSTEFNVKPNEQKEIVLQVRTVYFLTFNVAPAIDENGKIGYAYVVATVRNIFKPLPDSSIVLKVWFNNQPLEEITVATIPLLPLNDTEFKYNYIPKGGWKAGSYKFQMFLYSEGKLYAKTQIAKLQVTPEMIGIRTPVPQKTGVAKNIIILIVPIVIVIIVLLLVLKRRSPIKVLEVKAKDNEITITVKNFSNRDAMLLRLKVLALPSKVEILDIKKPSLSSGGKKLKGGEEGEIIIADEDGSIREAMESGGIIVRVETNIGVGEAKVNL